MSVSADAFQEYQSATSSTLDFNTGLLTVTNDQYAKLKTLSFHIGSTSYDLSPNAQIWPRSLNTAIGGSSGSIYLVVNDLGSPTGSGLDFINGYTFLYVLSLFFHSYWITYEACIFFVQGALLQHLRYYPPTGGLCIHGLYQRDHQLEYSHRAKLCTSALHTYVAVCVITS